MMDWGVDVYFADGPVLCPGCSMAPSPGYASFAAQHIAFQRLDVESAVGGAPVCASPKLSPLPLPGFSRCVRLCCRRARRVVGPAASRSASRDAGRPLALLGLRRAQARRSAPRRRTWRRCG